MRLNYTYYNLKEHTKGKNLIAYIKKMTDTIKNKNSKANLLGSLGDYYHNLSEYENFINYKLQAIEYLLQLNKNTPLERYNIGASYLQIADAYSKMKQYEKTIEYCNYAEPYLNQPDGIAFLYNVFIEAYTNSEKIDSALKTYAKLNQLTKKNPMLEVYLSFANKSMADFYLENKQLQLADDYANKALLLAEKSQHEEVEMEANLVKGKILFQQKKYPQSIEKLNKALGFAFTNNKASYAEINKALSENYAALNQWKKAYKHNKIFSQTNDSLSVETSKKNIANAEAKYQNRSKQQEIKSLSAENTIQELSIKSAKKQRIYLISGLIAIAIIGGLLYNQSRNRKKINHKLSFLNNQLDKANKNKMRFFGILNHDLRSPVASLVHFLHLQKDSPELLSEETKTRLSDQTVTSAEQLLQQMEDLLLWSKSQMEKFQAEKKSFSVELLFSELQNEFVWVANTELVFENPSDLKLFSDKEYLKTVLRNLIGNAIKVLENKAYAKIFCSAKEISGFTKISIKDNGGGTNIEKFKALYDDSASVGIKQGLGLHVIRDLCNAINAEIEVKTDQEIGETEIVISIAKG
jgi:signal transduction histidine kinase